MFSFFDCAEEKTRDSLDDSIFHVDVCTEGLVIVHDLPSFDQETVTLRSNTDDLRKLHRADGAPLPPAPNCHHSWGWG